MFEIRSNFSDSHFYICTEKEQPKFKYLHCDGRVINVCEYFESKEAAQKVLDKYYPKPKHKWVHGDVFRRKSGTVMVYLVTGDMGSVVYLLDYSGPGKGVIDICLSDARFLFNIKEKTNEKNN